jgi:hypothetical protein
MKIIKAIFISIGAGILSAFVSAIILGILNLFLSGHGNSILEKDYFNGPILYGGIDDVILIIMSFVSAIAAFVFCYRSNGKQPPSL